MGVHRHEWGRLSMSLYSHSYKAETCFWLRRKPYHARLTAISLQTLREIAIAEHTSMSRIAAVVDHQRPIGQSLTSAIRDWILQWLLENPMTLPRAGLGRSAAIAMRPPARPGKPEAVRRRRPSREPIASAQSDSGETGTVPTNGSRSRMPSSTAPGGSTGPKRSLG